MKFLQAGLLMLTLWWTGAQAASLRAAVFDFELDDTSLEGAMKGTDAAEQARLAQLDVQLRDVLTRSGKYTLVDMAPIAAQARTTDLQACDACAISLAHKVGAQVAITGWVQKVSNLILNINLEIRDVATGRIVQGGSVDIRGDTDESWSRGLAFLIPRLHLTTDRQPAR
ncbi:MAG TPA: DUF3280 domain-containing protein [Acetobacteraceae bacterium]|nr:DUF3280 domain-containing protein [Acetobacteraceae bacterium]